MIFLDSASTTKPVDSILEIITPYVKSEYFNPSAKYKCAEKIKDKIEEVRCMIADSINANPEEIYFTSGASESNSWAIRGFVDYCNAKEKGKQIAIISSGLEHKSIRDCIRWLNLFTNNIVNPEYSDIGMLDREGIIRKENIKDFLVKYYGDKYKIFTTICMGNNEIGTIQDIKGLAEEVHKYNGVMHTDATQCYGHIPIDVKDLGVDLLSASAQKLGGLKGTGFLYISKGMKDHIFPLIYGSQERSFRGGTSNVIGIIAFGEAVKNIDYKKSIELKLKRNYMIEEMIKEFDVVLNGDACILNGNTSILELQRLPNNINVTFKQNITAEALLYMLECDNILVSAGSACNSQSIKPSKVLQTIGLTDDEIMRTLRITLPYDISYRDIDRAIDSIEKAIKILTK